MLRGAALALLVLALMAVPAVAGATTAADSATTTAPVVTTTTAPAPAAGTSPWVLVPIGAGLGAIVGTFTGLVRRRRAERERDQARPPAES
jgi:hypothetical protein